MPRQIEEAINRIERRFISIQYADDFIQGDSGLDKLDGIAMMLIWLGESLKNLEKYGGPWLLEAHPDIDWKRAKGARDILSHHYGNLDAEIVFNICTNHIQDVKITVKLMQQELNNGPDL